MTPDRPYPEDLSARARRGEASPTEERRLGMVLGASAVERWVHTLGQTYDLMSTDSPDDDTLLARVVDRVARQEVVPRARWGRRVGIALACAAGLATLGAAALTLPRAFEGSDAPRPAAAIASARPAAAPAPAPLRDARFAAAAPAQSSAPKAPAPPSAAEQFAQANALRKSGRTAAAVATYRRLQRQHPASSEAVLSHVLLGRILLGQGAADAAAGQYSRYLRSSPGGSLTEEALHGRATALRLSGRTAEERQTYQQLIRRFPDSIYARQARERLRGSD